MRRGLAWWQRRAWRQAGPRYTGPAESSWDTVVGKVHALPSEVPMPLPHAVANANRVFTNRVLRQLSGIGPFAELEHVGRRSGRVYRTVILAFRHGPAFTVALTYGPDVDWLRNIEAAGGGRLRRGREVLALGPVTRLPHATGRARMPAVVRLALTVFSVTDFVELPVLSADSAA